MNKKPRRIGPLVPIWTLAPGHYYVVDRSQIFTEPFMGSPNQVYSIAYWDGSAMHYVGTDVSDDGKSVDVFGRVHIPHITDY